MDYAKESLRLHGEWKGKIEVVTRVPAENKDDLSLAYTPGVAQPCLEIQKDVNKSYDLTRRWNMCLVVTDGSAILGLGNIGPEAGMPVMEGKCALFKAFGDVDAFPLCIKSNDVDEIVNTIYLISGSFGGVNLEDISAPRCFEIEKKLKEKCDIPIFHDDQHGTAIVVSAGLTNALRLVGKKFSEAKVVINGAGSAGISICKLLLELGIGDVVMVDRKGILAPGEEWMNPAQKEIAEKTRERIRKEKRQFPLDQLKTLAEKAPQQPSFLEALKKPGMSYICEVKKASPSKGLIAPEFPYLEIAKEYEASGASAISCLTEPFYFMGSDTYLREITETVDIPVLRKDFTVDKYMIYQAKAFGASAVLLICAILNDQELLEYRELAEALGMDALVEAHDENEVARALKTGAKIVGVNNRDLKTFKVDMNNSIRLRNLAPDNVVFVSESGIKNAGDIAILERNRVGAVLIGETLMRSPDKKAALENLNGGALV